MKIRVIWGLALAAAVVAGCATKHYPIAAQMGTTERAAMTCRELDIERERAIQLSMQINKTGQTNWRSVAGFLGDWGIGNAMARSDAEKALSARLAAIDQARQEKNCGAQAPSS